ncbi:zinc ribbon domain-containing protein [Bremerella sp. JC770]|uniref:zinc ribbon domain-containing protein n=1 Tax=Bremerella sp. JC770 TaxID=3232137 RepID=UPI0034573B49
MTLKVSIVDCPACGRAVPDDQLRCRVCNYGVRIELPETLEKPAYPGVDSWGDSTISATPSGLQARSFEEDLALNYRCDRCRSYGAKVKRVASTGAGLTRILNWQLHEFIVASCLYCGLVQHFDASIVGKEQKAWRLADLFFEIT